MTPINQQIEQIEALALRHYPDNENQRNACLVRLLTERLRTYGVMFQPLPVVEMKEFCRFPDCNCPMDPGPDPAWCARGLPHER